jgi:hypothetical protein
MRARDFIVEASALNKQKLIKRPGRVEKFLDLVSKQHQFNTDSGPVVIDPNELDNLAHLLDPNVKTGIINVKTKDGKVIPLGSLHYNDAVFSAGKTGREASKTGDTSVDVKPGKVLGHGTPEKGQPLTTEVALDLGAVPGGDLGTSIQANKYLDTLGPVGVAIKTISKQIEAGQIPSVPTDLPPKVLTNIQNDAFEYLGVQALIRGVADFTGQKEFKEHLGSDLSELIVLFPSASNNPLTDSYALKSSTSENTIFISSKGGAKSGAPQSINKIKIPEYMMNDNDPAIGFIKTIQLTQPAWQQPFRAANYLHQVDASAFTEGNKGIPMPFSDEFLNWVGGIWKNRLRQPVPQTLEEIPKEYRPIFAAVEKGTPSPKYPLFYNLRNYVKDKVVRKIIIDAKVLPNFSAKMLEILGHNFIVLVTKPQGGKFVTTVKWPSKMGGTITFEPKDPADKWDSAMTWKLN